MVNCHTFQGKSYLENCVIMSLRIVLMVFKGRLPKVELQLIGWLGLYCILCLSVNVFLFTSVHFLPLGTVGCVQRALQFLSVVVVSRVFLGERIKVIKIFAVLLCVAGKSLVPTRTGKIGEHFAVRDILLAKYVNFTL